MTNGGDAVNQKTFWTVISGLAILTISSFGHSQYLDSQQNVEKREWRQDFKSDVKGALDGVKESVKDLKIEQRQQSGVIREDMQRIQDSINRLLADRQRERSSR